MDYSKNHIGRDNIVLLPTYNERKNIKSIIIEIFNILPETKILVVDDNSPDGTAEVVMEMMKKYKNLNILKRFSKTGLGDAYKEAIKMVLEDESIKTVITMDADGSHDPRYLVDLLNNVDEHDLIIGSRYVEGGGVSNWEFWRRILSKFGNLYSKFLTGLKINDLTAGFVCVKTKLLREIDFSNVSSAGYAYQIEFKFNCSHIDGVKIKEIPIIFQSRREGESKMSNQIINEGLKTPLRLFKRRLWKKK